MATAPLEGFLLGAVSGASALTLAGVLAPLLLGSATIALARVQTLAGMLLNFLFVRAIRCLQHGGER